MTDADNSGSTKGWLDRIYGVFTGKPQNEKQLLELLKNLQSTDLLGADEITMIEGVLQVGEMRVRDIMVPRAQMVVIEEEQVPETFVHTVVASGHSRFPVIGDNRDEVEGILLAKDLLAYFASPELEFDIRDAMRPAVFVPESKRLNVLLGEFRASRNHMAIVVDEYSGVAGLVTIEDVLEQIVGEIDDEHDTEEERYIKARSHNEYIVKALTPIEDFNEYFDVEFSEDEYDTIGGLVVKSFGYMPQRGEKTVIGDFHFEVIRASKRRLHLLQMRRLVSD